MKNETIKNKNYTRAVVPVIALFAVFVTAGSCDEDHDHDEGECSGHGHLHDGVCHCDNGFTNDPNDATQCVPVQEESFECTTEREGWEQCVDGKVQFCHIDHFHWGADCATLGYECVELTESTAACLDENSTCVVGEFKCETNTAYNCVDEDGHGHWAIEPCGTAAYCHEEATEAHCESAGGECGGHGLLHEGVCECFAGYAHDAADTSTCVIDPAGMCTVFGGTPHQETVVTSFAEFENAHAELYEPIQVTLPATTSGYIHFDVTHDDEYVIFADNPAAVEAVMHRNQTDVVSFQAVGAVGACATEIPQHYHMDLVMDGETPPVEYVIRFSNQFATATTVRFMVVDK